jgi:hypothetical protein
VMILALIKKGKQIGLQLLYTHIAQKVLNTFRFKVIILLATNNF